MAGVGGAVGAVFFKVRAGGFIIIGLPAEINDLQTGRIFKGDEASFDVDPAGFGVGLDRKREDAGRAEVSPARRRRKQTINIELINSFIFNTLLGLCHSEYRACDTNNVFRVRNVAGCNQSIGNFFNNFNNFLAFC